MLGRQLLLSCFAAVALAAHPPGDLNAFMKWPMTPGESGIAQAHIDKLQKYVNHFQVALFVRVSTADTMELIESTEFSTKSVDVHDKSSDWGPHRGTVPVDPFFSKKIGTAGPTPNHGNLNPPGSTDEQKANAERPGSSVSSAVPHRDIMTLRSADIKEELHGQYENTKKGMDTNGVGPIHLKITKARLADMKTKSYIVDTLGSAECKAACGSACWREGVSRALTGWSPVSAAPNFPTSTNTLILDKANSKQGKAGRDMEFCMKPVKGDAQAHVPAKEEVHWFDVTTKTINPLYVWAYGCDKIGPKTDAEWETFTPAVAGCTTGSAVTGDYDLWMIAPHIKSKLFQLFNEGPVQTPGPNTLNNSWSVAVETAIEKIQGGPSQLTRLNYGMLKSGTPSMKPDLKCEGENCPNLNEHLGRRITGKTEVGKTPNEVFHHGPENENFFFLQELDKTLAVFIPDTVKSCSKDTGCKNVKLEATIDNAANPSALVSGVMKQESFGHVLAALVQYGFLTMPSPMYGVANPPFNGKDADALKVVDADFKSMSKKVHNMFDTFRTSLPQSVCSLLVADYGEPVSEEISVKEISVKDGLSAHEQKAMCNIIWSYLSYETSRLMYDVPLMCGHGMCAGKTSDEKDAAFQKEWDKKKTAVKTLCEGVTTEACTENAKAFGPQQLRDQLAYRCEGKVVGLSGPKFFTKASKCCQMKTSGSVAKRQSINALKQSLIDTCMKKNKACPTTQAECRKEGTAAGCTGNTACQWGIIDNSVCPSKLTDPECSLKDGCTSSNGFCKLERCTAKTSPSACKVPNSLSQKAKEEACLKVKEHCVMTADGCEPKEKCCPTLASLNSDTWGSYKGSASTALSAPPTALSAGATAGATIASAFLSDSCKAFDNGVVMEKNLLAVKALRLLLFERLAQAWTYLQGPKETCPVPSGKCVSQEIFFKKFDSLEMLPGSLSSWMSNHVNAAAVAKKMKGKVATTTATTPQAEV